MKRCFTTALAVIFALTGFAVSAEEQRGPALATVAQVSGVLDEVRALNQRLGIVEGRTGQLANGLDTLERNQVQLGAKVRENELVAKYELALETQARTHMGAMLDKDQTISQLNAQRYADRIVGEAREAARSGQESIRKDMNGLASWTKDGFHTVQLAAQEEAFNRKLADLKLEHANDGQNARLDGHDGVLREHDQRLDGHDQTLDQHGARLDGHDGALREHGQRLDGHDGKLSQHTGQLANHAGRIGGLETRPLPAPVHHHHNTVVEKWTTPVWTTPIWHSPIVVRPGPCLIEPWLCK